MYGSPNNAPLAFHTKAASITIKMTAVAVACAQHGTAFDVAPLVTPSSSELRSGEAPDAAAELANSELE
jgi:hypothetical protein